MGVEEAEQIDRTFEEIYRDSYPRLVGQLSVVTASSAEAEEVVQEAFARLWGRWPHVRDYENIEAWVRRVALNVATSRWRGQAPTSGVRTVGCDGLRINLC